MRRLLCILLLMCLPLHSIAMQGGGLLDDNTATISHELEHDEGVSHHHEDDGSVHYDDSDESQQHSQDHYASAQPVAPAAGFSPAPPPPLVASAPALAARFLPELFPDCPHRPPALSPG